MAFKDMVINRRLTGVKAFEYQERPSSSTCHAVCVSTATLVKTEPGALPEGKVKIRLEHDGTVLDVDEDDVEKASCDALPSL